MNSNLLPSELKAARAENHMSQAALASALGMNRNILSAFEQGKLLFGAEMQQEIVDFFQGKGIDIDLAVANPNEFPEDISVTGLIHFDRFQIPPAMPEETRERILDDIIKLETLIISLQEEPFETRIFGGFTEHTENIHQKLLVAMAAWYCRARSLQGWDSIQPCRASEASDEPKTHAEWVGQQIGEPLGLLADEEAQSAA